VDRSYRRVRGLNTCSILTERVLKMIPSVLTANNRYAEWTEGESVLTPENRKAIEVNHARHRFECDRQPLRWPRYCFDAWSNSLLRVRAEFDKCPALLAGESVTVNLNVVNLMYGPLHLDVAPLPRRSLEDRPRKLSLHPVAAALTVSAAYCCRHCATGFHAAVVAAQILRCVSGKTYFNPDDLFRHRFKRNRSLFCQPNAQTPPDASAKVSPIQRKA
jgi:hypothetical protein